MAWKCNLDLKFFPIGNRENPLLVEHKYACNPISIKLSCTKGLECALEVETG